MFRQPHVFRFGKLPRNDFVTLLTTSSAVCKLPAHTNSIGRSITPPKPIRFFSSTSLTLKGGKRTVQNPPRKKREPKPVPPPINFVRSTRNPQSKTRIRVQNSPRNTNSLVDRSSGSPNWSKNKTAYTPPHFHSSPSAIPRRVYLERPLNMDPGDLQRFLLAFESIYGDTTPPPRTTGATIDHPRSPPPAWDPPDLSPGSPRYLWTDAFALIDLLTLSTKAPYESARRHYLHLASSLADTVHRVLGRTRFSKQPLALATPTRPLAGGLRIGKPSNSGPDCDGQYHHYITLWIFALCRLALATGERGRLDEAGQLMRVLHDWFVWNKDCKPASRPRIYWKMDVNLSKPLMTSEGNLDPIDGLVTALVLRNSMKKMVGAEAGAGMKKKDEVELERLDEIVKTYKRMVASKYVEWGSGDPLDLGMALWTGSWMVGLGREDKEVGGWGRTFLERALRCLERTPIASTRAAPSTLGRRLAFREMGFCLGIKAYLAMVGQNESEGAQRLEDVCKRILMEWEGHGAVPAPESESEAERELNRNELRAITAVMYAAALEPGVFLKGSLKVDSEVLQPSTPRSSSPSASGSPKLSGFRQSEIG
ncbi:hypothetical protein BDZ91DRAFT_709176 [Kalaharituber pfeilii]|nr:hypothetical protein BDZ91DRAFT_709176 [Kalaharituber pfeilii]